MDILTQNTGGMELHNAKIQEFADMNDKITNRDIDNAVNQMLDENAKASKSVAMNDKRVFSFRDIKKRCPHKVKDQFNNYFRCSKGRSKIGRRLVCNGKNCEQVNWGR